MRMAQCVHCGRTYAVGVAYAYDPPACPHCKEVITGPPAEGAPSPQVRVVESLPASPPPRTPPSSGLVPLKRFPWKIALGVVSAALVLLLIRSLIVGGEEEPPEIVSAESEPPPPPPPLDPADAKWEVLKIRFDEALRAKAFDRADGILKEASAEFEESRTADVIALYQEFRAALKAATPEPAPTAKAPPKKPADDTSPVSPEKPADPEESLRGPVGHWKFEEGSGANVADASGNGNKGVLNGKGYRWADGRLGSSVMFLGQDAYVSCGVSRMPSAAKAQSIAFWFLVSAPPTEDQVVVSLTNDAQKSGVEIGFRQRKLAVWRWGAVEIASTPLPDVMVWHHVTYAFDGTNHLVYVNGKEAARSSVSQTASPPTRLELGHRTRGKNAFHGKLDDVRIYDRAVTAKEISALIDAAPAPVAGTEEKLPPGAVDLLKLIDPSRDSVRGTWVLDEGALRSPVDAWTRIEIPYSPPEEYDLELVATRTGDVESLNIGLFGGGRQFHALIDGYDGSKSGLDQVDKRSASDNPTTVMGMFLKNNEPSTVLCAVRKGGVTVTVDGKEIIAWKGGFGRLGLDTRWEVSSRDTLSIGCYKASFRIERVVLTPVSGTGRIRIPLVAAEMRPADNPTDADLDGLNFEYYEGIWTKLPPFPPQTAVARGAVDTFDLSPRRREDHFGFRFTGYVRVPAAGMYTFFVKSDDGCVLRIGSTVVVNNDFTHWPQEKKGAIKLAAGKHAVRVEYFEHRLHQVLQVQWEGPSFVKQPIPKSALFRRDHPVAAKPAPAPPPPAAKNPAVPAAAVPLSKLKKDAVSKEASERLLAVRKLAAHRDRSVRSVLLRRLTSDSSEQVRKEAALSLAAQKHPDAATALARGFLSNRTRKDVALKIIRALGTLDMCASIPPLLSILEADRGAYASEALYEIDRIKCPEAAPGLAKLYSRAASDYQKAYTALSRTGVRRPVDAHDPKYPLAHVYTRLYSTLSTLVGRPSRLNGASSWDAMFNRKEHLKNLKSTYLCEATGKTFEMTVQGRIRTCPLDAGARSHSHTFLKHEKP